MARRGRRWGPPRPWGEQEGGGAPPVVITVSPSDVPDGQVGEAYSQVLSASGGTGPYTFAVTGGTLPGGLTLSSAGLLSGTPNAAASFSFTVTATNTASHAGNLAYSMDIAAAAVVGAAALLTDEANGFAADFTYTTDAKRVAVKETLGPELITNGGFDSDTSWSKEADWSIAGGVATKVAGAATRSLYQGSGVCIVGRLYRFTYTLVATGSGGIIAYAGNVSSGGTRTTSGTFSDTVVATTTNGPNFAAALTWTGTIDNVSVKEVLTVGAATTTEYGVNSFFSNAGTSPKQVYDVAGTLVWSPHNMCLQSQTFEQATPWNPTTAVTVTANAIAAPDGTLTADRLVETTGNNNHQIIHANVTQIVGATYTASVYAKAGERNWLSIAPFNATPADWFDLTNGVVGTSANGGTMTSVGDGWYRCSITYVYASAGGPNIYIRTANGQSVAYVGDITKGLYVWGAQLVRGSVPTAHLPTTTAARFGLALDYDPVTHAAKGLLCEPAGTNVQVSSVDGTNATYWATTGMTPTRGATAPNGQAEATTLTETIATSIHYMFAAASGRPTLTAVPYTFSVYLKAGTRRYVTIAAQSSSNGFYVTVDTQAWTITNSANMGTGWTYASSSLQNVGNGWYRVSITGTPAATGLIFVIQGSTTSTGAFSESYLGDGSTIIWWGIQVETGTVATSPIPTYAASATRAVDNYSCTTGQINHSATTGSMIAIGRMAVPSLNNYFASLNDATANEVIGLRMSVNKGAFVIDGGAIQFAPAGTAGTTARAKLAMAWAANDFAFSADGSAAETDVAGTLPTVTRLSPGELLTPTAPVNVESIVYVPRRMSNAELVTKTTP